MTHTKSLMPPVVNAQWLLEHLDAADVRVVEASWHMPATGRNAREEFADIHIPGAVFFDIDEHTTDSHLPHMLPDAAAFAQAVGKMGIGVDDRIVVYDSLGLFSAARVWWMFKYFGANNVAVLDGGLPAWQRANGAVQSQADAAARQNKEIRSAVTFSPEANVSSHNYAVADAEFILQARNKNDVLIIDARSANRFSGQEAEARAGLASGHIPGSVNVPFTDLLDEQGTFKSAQELRAVFKAVGLEPQHHVVGSCGSGVTAAIIILALNVINHEALVSLYDGSWTEWGALPDVPISTGKSSRLT